MGPARLIRLLEGQLGAELDRAAAPIIGVLAKARTAHVGRRDAVILLLERIEHVGSNQNGSALDVELFAEGEVRVPDWRPSLAVARRVAVAEAVL